MKKIFLCIALAAVSLGALAQTDLTGRVYSNPNIMADEINKLVSEVDSQIDSIRQEAFAKVEKKKGRKLTEEERAKVSAEVDKAQDAVKALKKGIKASVRLEFQDTKNVVMRMKMSVEDEALKAAGIPWAKRKLMKAALAIAPSSDKGTYHQQGNLIIIEDEKEPDTLRLSADGKHIYGTFDKKKCTLTRVQ